MKLIVYLIVFLASVQICKSVSVQCSDGKVTITEQTIPGEVVGQPTYLGTKNQVVLIQADDQSVWRSPDEGSTWTQMGFGDDHVTKIIVGKDKNSVLFLTQHRNVTWVSRDAASTLTRHETGFWMNTRVKVHPTTPDWVVDTGINTECTSGGVCEMNLYLSKDMGATWKLLRKYVVDAYWANSGKGDIPNTRLFAWEWEDKRGSFQSKSVYDRILTRSEDLFDASKPTKVLLRSCAGVLYYQKAEALYAANWYKDGNFHKLGLSTSRDSGDSFQQTVFSTELSENGYTILDSYNGAAFINVQHGSSLWGNLYVSDGLDKTFTESLKYNKKHRYNIRSPGGLPIDFSRVGGLHGVYMANAYITNPSESQEFATHVSYDMGGRWNRLRAPEGSVCPEDTGCFLNLYGKSTTNNVYGYFYSRPNAVGILLGQGTTGSSLNDITDVSNVKTYISRDAGWTWTQFYNESVVYEISNAGALVVAAADTYETDSILYTWTEGQKWSTCNFTADAKFEKVDITNIISEPGALSTKFIAWGTRRPTEADPSKGVILHLDFSNQKPTQCNLASPGSEESDYEKWSPSDSVTTDKCLMGQRVQYIRRKPFRDCYNGPEFNATKYLKVSVCPCSEEDFECDYCFVEDDNGKCVFNTEDEKCPEYDPNLPPSQCDGTWHKTQGYRLVPGNQCDKTKGIQDRFPVETPCPPSSPTPAPTAAAKPIHETHVGRAIFVIFVLVVLLVAILGALWYISGKHAGVRGCLSTVIPEKMLPAFTPPPANYASIQQDDEHIEDDAKPIDLDNDSDHDEPGEEKAQSSDDEFDPRVDDIEAGNNTPQTLVEL
mmetsp:Transcript_2878/g.3209  ORF Transcript_2878/g.3209 Transcript_2878/m.3209 type:complete len:830 (+) Transcript_2878:64-2553(+)